MTTTEFRQDRSRCSMLERVLKMPVVKAAFDAAFEDLDNIHARVIEERSSSASPDLELRLMNERKGYLGLRNTLYSLLTQPIETAPEEPISDYGAGEQLARQASESWAPVEPVIQ